jgi:outer membrane protein OmpA-like peptidoglycan-associated protein
MAFNILDAAKSFITPDILGKAAAYLGESESAVGRAVSGLIPASLLGITQKAESGGASMILDLAKQAMNSGLLSNLGNAFSTGGGGIPEGSPGLLSSVFGEKVGGISNAIAQFAGIKGSSAASLLGSIAPMVLGFLGKHSVENGLSASGLSSLLSNQKSSFLNAMPAGLNLTSLLGIGGSSVKSAASYVEEPKKAGSWLMPILLGLAAVALLLYIFKGCDGTKKEDVAVTEHISDPVPDPTPAGSVPIREALKVKLVDGTEINAFKGGIEDRLVACLNDTTCVAGKDQWFDFDNLNFETGSARLTAESIAQIRNIVAILKAYPAAKIKIGGYTDKVGNDEDNKKLSQERADAVLTEILKEGANKPQLVGAEGYGEELAKIAETASDEERRVDRRISVQLREK